MGDRIRKDLVKFDVINDDEDERNRNDGRKNDRKGKTTIITIINNHIQFYYNHISFK